MEEKQWWTFTFGYGQQHEGMYVEIYGTFESARRKMFERYGAKWAFQYNEKEWRDWEKDRPPYIAELLLEKIDEEGEADFSNCDLKKAVEENIKLPNTEGWILDDFTVLME